MSPAASPEQVVRAVTAGVGALIAGQLDDDQYEGLLDDLANLYAEQTDVRHPLAPLGDTPLRTRAELRRHFAEGPGRARGAAERYDAVGQVHETADPEVVVFEFRYVGVADGREFSLPCVFVTRVRDGLIVESRDYHDHVGTARAFGRVRDLAEALTA